MLHPITNNRSVTVFFDVVFQILTLYGMSSLEVRPLILPSENEQSDLATAWDSERHLKFAMPFNDVRPSKFHAVFYTSDVLV